MTDPNQQASEAVDFNKPCEAALKFRPERYAEVTEKYVQNVIAVEKIVSALVSKAKASVTAMYDEMDGEPDFSFDEIAFGDFVGRTLAQALQSRDAENDQDKTAREIAWDAVTHIRENNLPIEGSYLVNYFEQAIDRGKAAIAQELARVKKDSERLDWLEREKGYFQDDSCATVKFSADDATRTWHLDIGKSISSYGSNVRQAIDRAVAGAQGEEK